MFIKKKSDSIIFNPIKFGLIRKFYCTIEKTFKL